MPINAVYKNNKLVPLCNIKRFNLVLQPTFSISICFNLIQQPTFCKDVFVKSTRATLRVPFLSPIPTRGERGGGGGTIHPTSLLLLNFPKMYIWNKYSRKKFLVLQGFIVLGPICRIKSLPDFKFHKYACITYSWIAFYQTYFLCIQHAKSKCRFRKGRPIFHT